MIHLPLKGAPLGDRILATVWILIVAGILGVLAWSAWILLFPLVGGYLLATILAPIVERLDRRGVPRTIAGTLVLGSVVSSLGIAAWFAIPVVFEQIGNFRAHSGQYVATMESRLQGLYDILRNLIPPSELVHMRRSVVRSLGHHGSPFDNFQELFAVLPFVEGVILTLVVAFFLLTKGTEIRASFVKLVPNRYFEMTLRMLHRIQRQTSDYIRGQTLDSMVNAILISTALWIMGIPYALLIGCFAGFANVVPVLGPIVGGIPAVLLALLGATTTPWWVVALVLLAIHMLDNFVIYPSTVGNSLSLPAWVVILGIALGGEAGGIVGMLVAVPLLGLVRGIIVELHASLVGFRIL